MSDARTDPDGILSPRLRTVWFAEALLAGVVVAVAGSLLRRIVPAVPAGASLVVGAVVATAGAVYAALRYRSWRYEVRDDALYLERGVFTTVRTVVPFVRIQHVDSSRSPVERATGLGSTVVYTAGSRGADVTVPGLSAAGADELRERLKRLAIRAEGDDGV